MGPDDTVQRTEPSKAGLAKQDKNLGSVINRTHSILVSIEELLGIRIDDDKAPQAESLLVRYIDDLETINDRLSRVNSTLGSL